MDSVIPRPPGSRIGADPQAEGAIYDAKSKRRFAEVELSFDTVPDKTSAQEDYGGPWVGVDTTAGSTRPVPGATITAR